MDLGADIKEQVKRFLEKLSCFNAHTEENYEITLPYCQKLKFDVAILNQNNSAGAVFEIKYNSGSDAIWCTARALSTYIPRSLAYFAVRRDQSGEVEIARIIDTPASHWKWIKLEVASDLIINCLTGEDKLIKYLSKIMDAKRTLDEKFTARADSERIIKYFFRGENKRYEKLVPSLFRSICEDGKAVDLESGTYYKEESFLVLEAKRRHCEAFRSCNSYIEDITVAQHYEIPTRLLDITGNALVALYFAANDYYDNPGRVYVIGATNEDYRKALESGFSKEISFDDYHVAKKNSRRIDEVMFAFPSFLTERQKAQDGSFLFFGNRVNPFAVSELDPLKYVEIEIAADDKMLIKRQLEEDFNIHRATLFPESLAYCKQKIVDDARKRILIDKAIMEHK